MQVLRCAPGKPAPWKNGGGTTREIALHPSTMGEDEFLWRVSVAEISRQGGFSHFPEVDRQLMLLDGAGLELRLPEGVRRLCAPFERVRFAGERPVDCVPLGGPCLAFNVMTRRGRYRASLEVVRGAHASSGVASQRLFFVAAGSYIVEQADGARLALQRHEAITVPDSKSALRFEPTQNATLVEVGFSFG